MEYKRALVTGGAGFIGSHITEKLLARGIEVVVLDDLSVGKKENIPTNAEFIEGNVCDPEIVRRALAGVDVVFHEAARVSIRDSFRGFVEDARANVMGTVNILKCMEGSGVKKFIYASSMAAYGDAKYLPIDEGHPLEPTSPYGVSKLASEKYIHCFCQYAGIDSVILRYFNTYGPKQTFSPYVGVITIFIQKLLRDENLPIFGDGNQVRDFINVDDVAEANVLAMEYNGSHQIFNIGTGVGTTVNSLAEILKEIMEKPIEINYLPLQPGEPSSSVADVSLAKKELGFIARLSLLEKLPEVIEWNRLRK
jgi:UDP-glucose 4-epimerase